jgi:hypothetical protein
MPVSRIASVDHSIADRWRNWRQFLPPEISQLLCRNVYEAAHTKINRLVNYDVRNIYNNPV